MEPDISLTFIEIEPHRRNSVPLPAESHPAKGHIIKVLTLSKHRTQSTATVADELALLDGAAGAGAIQMDNFLKLCKKAWPYADARRSGQRRDIIDPAQSSPSIAHLQKYGPALFKWIVDGNPHFQTRIREVLMRGGDDAIKRIRFCTEWSETFRDFPCELMFFTKPAGEWQLGDLPPLLAATPPWSIVRSLPVELIKLPEVTVQEFNVLVAVANPPDVDKHGGNELEIEKEVRNIDKAFANLGNMEGRIRMLPLHQASLHKIKTIMEGGGIQCFHFIGHCKPQGPNEDEDHLILCDENGLSVPVTAEELLANLRPHGTLDTCRLVVLNACRTMTLAVALIKIGRLPALVATQFPVQDEACSMFAGKFYEYLAGDGNVENAVTRARSDLRTVHSTEWGSFVLYLQSEHGKLFHPWRHRPISPKRPDLVPMQWIKVEEGHYLTGLDGLTDEMAKIIAGGPLGDRVVTDPGVSEKLATYWITMYPITRKQFLHNPGQKSVEVEWPLRPFWEANWQIANAFAKEERCKLPTRQQWEKAARGTADRRPYPWEGGFDRNKCICRERGDLDPSFRSKPEGASRYGVEHMVGNVAEWILEDFGNGFKGLKGGACNEYCRLYGLITYTRMVQHGIRRRGEYVGFRLVSEESPLKLNSKNFHHEVVSATR